MSRFPPHSRILAALAMLLQSAAIAYASAPPSVSFAPGIEATLQAKYGEPEVPALRSEVVDSVSAALKAAGDRCNLDLEVVLQRAAPSHPTLKQQLDDPAMDPFRTVFYHGGAALTGQVLGADGRVLQTVTHERFADNRSSISAGKDPWSDARVAIGQFSDKLVKACRRQTGAAGASH